MPLEAILPIMFPSFTTKSVLIRAVLTIGLATSGSIAATIPPSQVQTSLTVDDLILLGNDGRAEIVPREEYLAQTRNVPIATAEQHYNNKTESESQELNNPIGKRCLKHNVISMKSKETFVDWDVIMSDVILAPPNKTASVSISEGHRISQKLNQALGLKTRIVEAFFLNSLKISLDETWTTTKSTRFAFTIPPGKFGAIVSNPLTTRHSGYLDSGCIGNSERTEFSSDTYQSKNFDGLSWVEGVIGLCLGDTFPLPRCRGEGYL